MSLFLFRLDFSQLNAKQVHNIFNIVYVGVIATMSTYSWWMNLEGDDLYLLSVICVLYYFLDTAFIAIRPDSVNSTRSILLHHVFTFIFAVETYRLPSFRSFCVQYLLVDINTWFLMVRQMLKERYLVIEVPFYVSWVLIRLVYYPYLMFKVWGRFHESLTFKGLAVLTIFLNILNFKWSIALFKRLAVNRLDKDYAN